MTLCPAILHGSGPIRILTGMFRRIVALNLTVCRRVRSRAFLLGGNLLSVFHGTHTMIVNIRVTLFRVRARNAGFHNLQREAGHNNQPH